MTICCPNCGQPFLTTAEVAERLELAAVTVRGRAKERGIGVEVDARARLYTEADVAKLAELKPRGRPRKTLDD